MKKKGLFESLWDDDGKEERLTFSLVLITIFLFIVTAVVWCKEGIKKRFK